MSGSGFRIMLNISNFFSDHRRRARLFINDEIETIGRLQKKISSMFGINNFYLICDNEYLHPSENIQVLDKDDLIWVMPDTNQLLDGSRQFTAPQPSSSNDIQSIDRRKRKANKGSSIMCDSPSKKEKQEDSENESDSERIKKKKKKFADICESDDSIVFKRKAKLKKAKRDKDIERKQDQIEIKSLDISKEKGDRSISEKKSTTCKGDLSFYVKKKSIQPTTNEYLKEKRVNIVRIDYIKPQIKTKSAEKMSTPTTPVNFAPNSTPPIIETLHVQNPSLVDSQHEHAKKREEFITAESTNPVEDVNRKHQNEYAAEHLTQNTAQEAEQCCEGKELKQRYFETPEYVRKPRANTSPASSGSGNSNCRRDRRRQGNLFQIPPYLKEDIPMTEAGDDTNVINIDASQTCEDVNMKLQNGCLSKVDNTDSNEANKSTGDALELQLPENKEMYMSDIFVKSIFNNSTMRVDSIASSISNTPSHSDFHHKQADSIRSRPGSRLQSREISGVGQLLSSIRMADHTDDTCNSEDVNAFDSNITKQRRRSRRRSKKKNDDDTNNVIVLSESPLQPKPLATKACPSIHIVFDEEEAKPDERGKATEATIPHTNMTPRVGDTIAFKVLKMSDDYSPTVSAYIVGKVVDFIEPRGEVIFNIISGLEELKEPKGKLSLEDTDDNENKQRAFTWSDLLQPKLLA